MSHDLYQHLLDMLGAKDHADAGRIIGELHAKELAAAPPAASVRAMELAWIEDRFGDEFATPAADQRYTVQALADGEWLALRNGERLNGEPEDVIYGTRAAGKAACQQHFNAYVRTLLAPVDEAEHVHTDECWEPDSGCDMGKNPDHCVRVGPEEEAAINAALVAPRAATSEAPVAWIPKCDFDGMATGRVGRAFGPQPDLLKSRDNCVPVYTHPAPLPAVAGVTEAMVETFEAKFLECARTRPDSTLRDDIRAALVAALGAREGK